MWSTMQWPTPLPGELGQREVEEGRAQSFEEKKESSLLARVVQQESRSYSLEDNLQRKPREDHTQSQSLALINPSPAFPWVCQ